MGWDLSRDSEIKLKPRLAAAPPSLHKCHVYGTPGTAAFNAARTVAQTLHIPHAEQGFITAGTPIGPATYVTQHVSA